MDDNLDELAQRLRTATIAHGAPAVFRMFGDYVHGIGDFLEATPDVRQASQQRQRNRPHRNGTHQNNPPPEDSDRLSESDSAFSTPSSFTFHHLGDGTLAPDRPVMVDRASPGSTSVSPDRSSGALRVDHTSRGSVPPSRADMQMDGTSSHQIPTSNMVLSQPPRSPASTSVLSYGTRHSSPVPRLAQPTVTTHNIPGAVHHVPQPTVTAHHIPGAVHHVPQPTVTAHNIPRPPVAIDDIPQPTVTAHNIPQPPVAIDDIPQPTPERAAEDDIPDPYGLRNLYHLVNLQDRERGGTRKIHFVKPGERGPKGKWYIVRCGRQVGVFNNWNLVQAATSGVTGASQEGADSEEIAYQAFIRSLHAGEVYIANAAPSYMPRSSYMPRW